MNKMYELTHTYHIHYIDYTLGDGDKAVAMSDSFDLDGYRAMIADAQVGDIHINRVDVDDPMNPDEYTTIYENPIQVEED